MPEVRKAPQDFNDKAVSPKSKMINRGIFLNFSQGSGSRLLELLTTSFSSSASHPDKYYDQGRGKSRSGRPPPLSPSRLFTGQFFLAKLAIPDSRQPRLPHQEIVLKQRGIPGSLRVTKTGIRSSLTKIFQIFRSYIVRYRITLEVQVGRNTVGVAHRGFQ